MGVVFGKLWGSLFGNKQCKIVILGLNNAGKTTILYNLHLGEVVVTQPTIGSNVEEITRGNINLVCWDLGGQESLRPNWGLYYVDTQAVILVVDSSDPERLPVVKQELWHMIEHPDLRGARVLVFANKKDLPSALGETEISEALGMTNITDHEWHIQACCALTGEGLEEGISWIVDRIKGR
eukprot:TRINITY_DN43523_c0_g1_i1.p1 TRINITY_DN43523_c0_g1~~TRINITY_DN43523_c0_g1_i1.p1  ORF type:complete len:208 (+),score=18.60 TRINITY_DN43523_c0_g1_i1:84-626(+)